MNFLAKKCVSCEGGAPALTKNEVSKYVGEVMGWVSDGKTKKLFREFKFKDFKEAMDFVSGVAEIAESEGHHPDIHIFYNQVRLELWTHAVNGLTENDFILAAKINSLI